LPVLAVVLGGCQATPPTTTAGLEPQPSQAVSSQVRREWRFDADGVRFDNRFAGARLNGVERIGPLHYRLLIEAESWPINPSPWYGFRVNANIASRILIELDYRGSEHRYHPKLSEDGLHWRDATLAEFTPDPATLHLSLQHRPLQVLAQRPVGVETLSRWNRDMATRLGVPQHHIGKSLQGRPQKQLELGGREA
jgi:hypothetical protein